jgi:hypothetical protein
MQIFKVIYQLSYKGEPFEDTVLIDFQVETFADLWMELELGEKDGSIKQRLVNATKEDNLKFDSFGFTYIYNQVDELQFDSNNPEKIQFTSLTPEGETLFEIEDEDFEEDMNDDNKTFH